MSSVDNHIVQMSFDNKQFESGVQTSIKSLDQLKKGLQLEESAQSLSNLERAGRSFSLGSIADGIDALNQKFSALGIVGITALQNITNAAINAGVKMASSFTIDPIKKGFEEYETKMGAIQTILTNTQGGQKKVVQTNSAAVKKSSEDAVSAAKEANADALDDLRKSQAKRIKEVQKTAEAEVEVLSDKYATDSENLDKANKEELNALNKVHEEKIKIQDQETIDLQNKFKSESEALNKAHEDKIEIYQKETEALQESIKKETEALNQAHTDKLKQYNIEYMAKLKVIDEQRYNQLKAIDDEINSIKNLTKAEQAELKQKEQRNKLSELQDKVNTAKTYKDRTAAEKALSDYQDAIRRDAILEERNAKIDSLETTKKTINDSYKVSVENLNSEYDLKKEKENAQYKIDSDNLKKQQTEKIKALNETHQQQLENLKAESETLKEQQTQRLNALNEAHKLQKENFKIETDLLKEQQNEKEKSLRKTYDIDKKLMNERHKDELDNIREEQDAAVNAMQKRNQASIKSMGSASGPVQYEITKGSSLEDVNKALAELNTYADKTIYNFSEMTRNVGTFTAAGVGLEDSVTAIKGIANLAAGSGSSSQQASTAMYQLSQALAAGSLKLQDWNSVVNAGMGGQLFQNALKDTAKSMGIVVNESIPFRESLESGWVTTDVLINTLGKLAKDESLLKAATQVRTFTQLVDTLKESMQSGWAQTWEYIIGDNNQASELFTKVNDSFGSMIQASSDARNSMLSFWSANGGRDAIIQGLINVFDGLASILKPIGDAFRQIFPPTTGEQLVSISKAFSDVTAKFKIGAETAANIKSTFAGLFAVLDLGIKSLTFVAQCVGLLFNALAPGAGGLLSLTGNIGDFIVSFRNMIVQNEMFSKSLEVVSSVMKLGSTIISTAVTDISSAVSVVSGVFSKYIISIQEATNSSDLFAKALEKIKAAYEFISEGLKAVIGKIKESSSEFGNIDTQATSAFSDKLSVAFEKLSDAGDRIKETFGRIIPVFKEIGSVVESVFAPAIDYVWQSIQKISLADVGTMLAGGGLFIIGKSIKDFIGSIGNVTKGFNEVIDGIAGSLEAFQTKIKAEAILKIAMAIGILAASVFVLAAIDQDSLGKALAALTTIFVELGASLMFLDKVSGVTPGITGKLLALGVAVLLIATAMKSISELDQNGIQAGVQGLAAILMLLAAFVKITDGTSGIQGSITGIIGLALGILILSKAASEFGNLDQKVLERGIQGVAASLMSLGVFLKLAGDPEHMIALGLGITGIAVAMNLFAGSVALFGLMSIDTLEKGIVSMAAILASIALMVKIMPNEPAMISIGVGLNLMALALYSMAGAIAIFGNIPLETLAIGIGAMSAALLAMSAVANLMNGTLTGAASLLVMAIAINTLVPAIALLGHMDIKAIGVALLAIAGVFTVLGVSALALAPLAPVILSLAGSIALLGLGITAIGGGLIVLAAGLTAIAVGGAPFIAALIAIAVAIFSLIPQIATKLGEGVVAFANAIANGMPALTNALSAIVKALIEAFTNVVPPLIEAAIKMMIALLTKISEYIEPLTDLGIKLIVAFLKGISANTREFTKVAIELILEFLKAINDKIGDVVKVGTDLIISFVDAILKMTNRLVEAGFKLIIDFINGLAKAIRDNMPVLIEAILNLAEAIIEGLANGLIGGVVTIVKAIAGIGKALIDGFKDVLGIHSPSRVFDDFGGYIVQGLINGLLARLEWLKNTVGDIGSGVISKFNEGISSFVDIGKNMMAGIIEGISGMATKVTDTIKGIGSAGVDGLKNLLGIHSPSRVFGEIGKFSMLGFANGISDFSNKVYNETENVGQSAIDSLRDVMLNLYDIVSGDMEMSPTIRPVMDLSDIENGTYQMNSMFSKLQTIPLQNNNLKLSAISQGMNANNYNQNGSVSLQQNQTNQQPLPPIKVTVVSQLNDREIARGTVEAMSEELANLKRRKEF